MVDVIRLQSLQVPRATIGEQLTKIKTLPKPLRFLASPKLTGALVTGLGIATGGIAVLGKSILTGLAIPTLAGVIQVSPKAEKILVGRLTKPEKLGETIGAFIEDPKKKVKEIPPLVAGLIGAGAVVGGAELIKKVKGVKIPKLPVSKSIGEKGVLPTGATFTPLAPVEKPIEEKPIAVKPVQIKNIFKPEVNISFKKSKKFINQQVNII